ncbi:MAG: leucine-rich repeat domain-containing protein [Bacteroidales bacterium]|nr:leucine-rich repeat domain-containing protein [Bacteroidales bacterium]
MKKALLNKTTFLFIFSILLTLSGFAQTTFTVGDLNYQVNDDGVSVTVTSSVGGQGATGELNIPESVSYEGNDYAVTAIGDNAFLYGFFTGELNIPNSITTIGDGAFAYCCCFTGDLIIPSSVTSIGYGAFQICYGFTGNLTIPNSVVSIGDFAFNSCDGMTGTLSIPSSVTSLGPDTFSYTAFSGITVDPENSVFDSRGNCNAIIATSTNELITGCQSTIIPNTVTTIGYDAFKGCMGLTTIDIPDSVTSIGADAFAFCYGLTGDLTIPNSVTTIGPGAFFYCSSLDGTLTIGESVTFIGDYAFRNCSGVTEAVSLAVTPPELGSEPGWDCVVFEYFGTPILTVPYGCASAYQSSAWYDPMGLNGFYEFIEDEDDDVTEIEGIASAVYPNPTHGVVRIEAEDIRSISIYGISGQKVFEGAASGDAFEYDFGKHEAGIYMIVVETAKSIETKRVTVL